MTTPARLKQDVTSELMWDSAIGTAPVVVEVFDDIATLRGRVASHALKWRAAAAALRVSGIKGVLNELDVRLPPACRRSDTEIAEAARHALRWNSLIPS